MKTELLQIRLSKKEKERLKELASKRGLKVSQYILQETIYKSCHDNSLDIIDGVENEER